MKQVTKQLIKNNPKVMDNFIPWYTDYAKERKLPDLNIFFDMEFIYTIGIWWDYFTDCGIYIMIGNGIAVAWKKEKLNPVTDKDYIYDNLSRTREIFSIKAYADPSHTFEEVVVRLIALIETPF